MAGSKACETRHGDETAEGERSQPADVLLIDDDSCAAARVAEALSLGLPVIAAGAQTAGSAGGRRVALVVCEVSDRRTVGSDLVEALTKLGVQPTLVVVTGSLSLTRAEGGAYTAVTRQEDTAHESPTAPPSAADLPSVPARDDARTAVPLRFLRPRGVADRWATYVWRACCASIGDLKTVAVWARCVAVSYSSLCETCRLLGIRPYDAREFTRVLSAIVTSARIGCSPHLLLDVSDRRTLRRIYARTGVDLGQHTPTAEELLRRQQFIPQDNAGLIALRALLASVDPVLFGFAEFPLTAREVHEVREAREDCRRVEPATS